MKTEQLYEHNVLNIFQTVIILLAMGLVLGLSGYILAGWVAALWVMVLIVPVVLLAPKISPKFILRLYRAQPLPHGSFSYIYEMTSMLAERADLPAVPKLYYLPSPTTALFTVGSKTSDATIVLTIGMLETLNRHELGGVLAHEIAHIRNRDLWLMSITDFISRLTGILSVIGQLLIFLFLPLFILSGEVITPLTALLIIIAAPYLNILLQLAFSRVREYHADITAAYLSGDTHPLASALEILDREEQPSIMQLLFPGKQYSLPSLLRTHPPTSERIKRLNELILPENVKPLFPQRDMQGIFHSLPHYSRRRDFFKGLWF